MHASSSSSSSYSSLLFTTLALAVLCSQLTVAEEHYYELVVKEETVMRRLCGPKWILAVNGESLAGPTVEVAEGDALIVRFVNRAAGNVTVHWTGWSDDQELVARRPIRPGNSYTYRLTIAAGQQGTLSWHAHSSCLRSTVHGALLILPPAGNGKPSKVIPSNHGKPLARVIPTILETCWEFPKIQLYCINSMCKFSCYMEAKSQGVNLGGYHCDGNGFWGLCICWFCKN